MVVINHFEFLTQSHNFTLYFVLKIRFKLSYWCTIRMIQLLWRVNSRIWSRFRNFIIRSFVHKFYAVTLSNFISFLGGSISKWSVSAGSTKTEPNLWYLNWIRERIIDTIRVSSYLPKSFSLNGLGN